MTTPPRRHRSVLAVSIVHMPGATAPLDRITLDAPQVVVIGAAGELAAEQLADPRCGVAPRHARLAFDGRVLTIEGVDGTVRIGGVEVRDATLQLGAVVQLGQVLLLVHGARLGFPAALQPRLAGVSSELARLVEEVAVAAVDQRATLLLGPAGMDAYGVAAEIHLASGRSGRFVAFDATQPVPIDLDEPAGTVFVDHVEAGNDAQQATLELTTFDPNQVLAKVVVAAHADLSSRVEAGSFRRRLYDQLIHARVRVPALSERLEDVPRIAAQLAQRHTRVPPTLSCELVAALLRYHWPGDQRELADVIGRIAREHPDAAELPAPSWLAAALPKGGYGY